MTCGHEEGWDEIVVQSCLLDSHDDISYHTFQCEVCGYVPNSDFKTHKLKTDCPTCVEFAKRIMRQGERGWKIENEFETHIRKAHPEINILGNMWESAYR